MKNFREEMRRGMGRGMIAAMLMTMFPMLLAVLGFLPDVYTEKYHASGLMVNALYKSGLTPVTFIAAAFAYSTSYIGDIANGALRYQLARCGRTRFALSRFWANAICGALGVALGEMAFFVGCDFFSRANLAGRIGQIALGVLGVMAVNQSVTVG